MAENDRSKQMTGQALADCHSLIESLQVALDSRPVLDEMSPSEKCSVLRVKGYLRLARQMCCMLLTSLAIALASDCQGAAVKFLPSIPA